MTIRFQAFLAATILVASGIIVVAANALADQESAVAKSERRVGDSQLLIDTPSEPAAIAILVARASD
jgi:hypothetical protein